MSQADYEFWYGDAVTEYAKEKAKAGNLSDADAMTAAEREYAYFLPDGSSTKNNYLYILVADGTKVGTLWLQTRNNRTEMFICDIRIYDEFQGKGYGKQSMDALEDTVKSMGINKITLHVFNHNEIAIGLYKRSGFGVTDLFMSKTL